MAMCRTKFVNKPAARADLVLYSTNCCCVIVVDYVGMFDKCVAAM